MPELKLYSLFISHSWTYGDAYDRLVGMLTEHPNFKWRDYSVPKDDPIHNAPTTNKLEAAIREQMRHASCVLIMAGKYSTFSKWINREIMIAQELGKPILAITPWGASQISSVVAEVADEIVKWQSSSIVEAIRNNAL